jgi:hypothetical protein
MQTKTYAGVDTIRLCGKDDSASQIEELFLALTAKRLMDI